MKKFLFLGLLLMLLAPLPVSAKFYYIYVNPSGENNISAYAEIFSLEGGTYCGVEELEGYEDDFYNLSFPPEFLLKYEFDDNQTSTRLHADLSNWRIKVYYGTWNSSIELNKPIKKEFIFESGDENSSDFVSGDISLKSDPIIYIDIYTLFSVNIEFLGEGLSAQLRKNYSYISDDPEYGQIIYDQKFEVLDQVSGPISNTTLKGYYCFENQYLTGESLSLCIDGFDWAPIDTTLLVIVNGDTIKNLNSYRETQYFEVDGYNYELGYSYRQGERKLGGLDIDLSNTTDKNIYAKLIAASNQVENYPITYRICDETSASVKSVDKSYTGNINISSIISGNYMSYFNVNAIDDQAMLNCKNITSLNIPASIKTIGVNALSGMASLEQIKVDSNNKKFSSIDGVLFKNNGNYLIQFPIAKATQYDVPEGTVCIERDAFYKSELTSITLPSTLRSIHYDAFGYSQHLKEIDIPSSVFTINEYVFDHCTSLTRVGLPSMTSLPRYFFSNCTALPTVDLPNKLQSIEDYAFTNCTALSNIVLPDGLQTIGNYAFNKCNKITNIKLPAGLQTIGENAFKGCDKLNRVVCRMLNPIPLPDNAFTDNVYNNAVLKVPYDALALYKSADGWKKFKNIIGFIDFEDKNVETICLNKWDSNGDSELDYTEAAAVTSLGSAFTGNTTIKLFNELKYFTGLTKIDDNAFKGCKTLQSVIVPANVKQIGKSAFYGDYVLTNIVLPEGLEVINDYAIGACTKLTEIELPSTLTTIKTRAFYYDKLLASINIPASVTSIGTYAFASCPVLMNVTANMTSPCAIASNVFTEDSYNKATLNVPYGTYAIYKATNYWSKFANIKTLAGQVSISAAPISIIAGKSGDMVLRLEQNLPSVSFQFDLTLANGITLQDASIIPSSDFVVSTAYVGNNKWRILAYSPTNKPIGENVGNLMKLSLLTEELLSAGTRTAIISGFTLTTLGANNSLSYITLDELASSVTVVDAAVTDAGKGDVNLDGIVNVQDIVVLINHIFGSTPAKFSTANADANGDGIVNVVDVSTIVLLCMPATSSNPAPAPAPAASLASMTWDTTNGLALTIADATTYVAAQMDVTVNGTLQVNNITAADGHTPVWQQIGENRYRVLVFSSSNDTFSAFGPHLFFDVQGEGEITLTNALLVDAAGDGFNAAASSTGVTTGITTITTELLAPADVYSMSGQLVRRQATSLKDLPAGIYLVNGRKMAVK